MNEANDLYTLKKRWAGYDAWVITSNLAAAKHIKLTPRPKIQLFNGALDCRFMRYELYSGSRRLDMPPVETIAPTDPAEN